MIADGIPHRSRSGRRRETATRRAGEGARPVYGGRGSRHPYEGCTEAAHRNRSACRGARRRRYRRSSDPGARRRRASCGIRVIILDTNVISEIFRRAPEPRVVDWLASLAGDVAITSITLAELLAGVRRLPDGRRRDELARRVDAALVPYRGSRAVLPFDDVAADRYADVLVARENTGAPISTADAQIAAICLAHGATCATRNVKDCQHTGVELVDPWKVDA